MNVQVQIERNGEVHTLNLRNIDRVDTDSDYVKVIGSKGTYIYPKERVFVVATFNTEY